MRKIILLLTIMIFLVMGCQKQQNIEQDPSTIQEVLHVEQFIQQHLLNDNGQLQTNITNRQNEYLSESLGLWMDYLRLKNDYVQFDQQVNVLKKFFLTTDHLVIWELQGKNAAPANAFIDDLRIIDVLYQAAEQWGNDSYTKLANKMSQALATYQTQDHLMVDFIELKDKHQGQDVTISYIIPRGLDEMANRKLIPTATYDAMKNLLRDAPFSTSNFFPKAYHLPTKEFIYDEDINMIDQFYVAYHRAQWGMDIEPFIQFTKETFEQYDGVLYGRYAHDTKKPIVDYESVAVYALAILTMLEVDEDDFAKELFHKMKTLQVQDKQSIYAGGYIDAASKETHSFDNLLALIAERTGKDQDLFE